MSNFKKLNLYLLILIILLFPVLAVKSQTNNAKNDELSNELKSFDSTIKLENNISKTINYLNEVIGLNVTISKSNRGVIVNDPKKGIILDLNEINNIFEIFKGDSTVNDVIKLILCHEYAHSVQFHYYGYDSLLRVGTEEKKVLECQADILGGAYAINFLPGLENDLYLQKRVLDAIDLLFKSNPLELSISKDHPNGLQRKAAFLIGLKAGIIDFLNRIGSGNIRFANPNTTFEQVIKLRKSEIDYDGLNLLAWSHQQAELITGYESSASKNILLVSENSKYIYKGKLPYVSYSLTYRNTGSTTVTMIFNVSTFSISPTHNYITPFDKITHKLILEPQKDYTVTGKLLVNSYNDYKLVYPPDDISLGTYQSINSAKHENISSSTEFKFSNNQTFFSINSIFGFTIDGLLKSLYTDNPNLYSGPYRKIDDIFIYQSTYIIPNSIDNKILVSKNRPILKSLLFEGEDFKLAQTVFKQFSNILPSTLSKLNYIFSETSDNVANDNSPKLKASDLEDADINYSDRNDSDRKFTMHIESLNITLTLQLRKSTQKNYNYQSGSITSKNIIGVNTTSTYSVILTIDSRK